MSTMDDKIEALDKLLHEVAESPALREVLERAEDSGHLDDDWIMALTTGAADEDDMRKARRHVVFCDQCAALLLNRGGEVAAAPKPMAQAPQVVADDARPRVRLSRRKSIAYALLFGVLVVLALVLVRIAPRYMDFGSGRNSGPGGGRPVEVLARGAGDAEAGRLSLSRLVFVRLLGRSDTGQAFAYVILVDGRGRATRLEPKGAGRALMRDFENLTELPGEFGGYNLKEIESLAAGQRVGFLILLADERIALLEGDAFERVTKKRIEELARDIEILDEAGFRALAGGVRDLELTDRVLISSIRLIP